MILGYNPDILKEILQIYGETGCIIYVINFMMYFLLKGWREISFGERNRNVKEKFREWKNVDRKVLEIMIHNYSYVANTQFNYL